MKTTLATDMSLPHLRPATAADATFVIDHLRAVDARACITATGKNPSDVMMPVLAEFGAETILAPDGELIGLCGVRPHNDRSDFGIVWMWGTDRVSRLGKLFLRHAPAWVAEQERCYPMLGNQIDLRNRLQVRWLALVGFRFVNVHEVNGYRFGVFMNARGAAEALGVPH